MTVRGYDGLPRNADLPRVVDASNRHNNGKLNCVAELTLTANTTTTTLTDARISPQSHINLAPLSANAAAEHWWVSAQDNGTATITHANAATTDRTFNVLIIG